MTIGVPVTWHGQTLVALIDEVDAHLLNHRWCSNGGYAVRWTLKGKRPMHREILGLEIGDPRQTHHLNEDKLDNRRKNLIVVANKMEHASQPHPKRDAACMAGARRGAAIRWGRQEAA